LTSQRSRRSTHGTNQVVDPMPVPFDAVVHPEPQSLLELAFSDAVRERGDDPLAERLLDAAYEQFCRMGIRRSTMEDVARRADVSRITVYRRFTNKDTLVEHVIRREFRRYFDQFIVDIRQAGSVGERVVVGFVSSLQAIRRNPLIGGLIETEPDAVAPSMVNDGGQTLATVQQFVAGRLRLEQRAGNVSHDIDVEVVAELMVRTAASFLLIPSRVVDIDDEPQLRALAWNYLVPMLQPAAAR
jgi:TetR/AcrR family transcriptional regulator, repressor for uid operon